MWLVKRNEISTKDNLVKRDWTCDIACPFCGLSELANHFFYCLFLYFAYLVMDCFF